MTADTPDAGTTTGTDVAAEFEALASEPRALISAVDEDGFFIPLPASYRVDRSRVLQGRTALDFVTADDRGRVIDSWYAAKDTGASRVEVRLAAAPDEATTIGLFDLGPVHGCYFCVLVMPEAAADVRPETVEGMASRVTWATKSDRAEFIDVDPDLVRILGWTPSDLAGEPSRDYIHPDDQELAIDNWLAMMGSGGDGKRVRLRHLHKEGHYVWMEITNQNHLDDPDAPHVMAQMVDISEEMATQDALREREQLLNRLAEALPSGLLHVLADGSVVYTNERLHEIVAVPATDRVERQLATILRDDWPAFHECFAAVLSGDDTDVEVRLQLPGEPETRLCRLAMRSLCEADGTVTAAIISVDDVTEAARLRNELHERATVDALTGCFNRATVMAALEERIAAGDEALAVVFLDLDRFKAINDELGHAAGDELLVVAADRLRRSVRPGDIIGRLGGDEFLAVCREVVSPNEAIAIAEHVAASMAREVELDAGVIELRSSVGVAWAAAGERLNADELVARADTAMYESKRRGAGRAVPYADVLRRHEANLDTEHELHLAIERGDLHVRFQPVVRMADGGTIGFEGLVQWSRPEGDVTASEFIEVAEDTGLIHALGRAARDELMCTAARHTARSDDDFRWFTNVSARELQMPGMVGSILETIDGSGLERGSVVVEFRADLSAGELARVTASLGELRAGGVELAIDDFGAGWASLDLLRVAAPRWVKLSSVLTRSVVDDPVADAMVRSTVDLARSLGAAPVAKGVETRAQRDVLVGLGIELGQGHLFAPAGPLGSVLGVVA